MIGMSWSAPCLPPPAKRFQTIYIIETHFCFFFFGLQFLMNLNRINLISAYVIIKYNDALCNRIIRDELSVFRTKLTKPTCLM